MVNKFQHFVDPGHCQSSERRDGISISPRIPPLEGLPQVTSRTWLLVDAIWHGHIAAVSSQQMVCLPKGSANSREYEVQQWFVNSLKKI
jgi:hypothetical protein